MLLSAQGHASGTQLSKRGGLINPPLFSLGPPHCVSDTHTLLGSVKFSIATSPCSRPKPESPEPPQGNRTSVYPYVFTQTVPALSADAILCTRPISALHTPAARL